VLSRLPSPPWAASVGGAEDACVKEGWENEEEAGGVSPGGILRMKFMGAFGFASAREKRPAVAVAEGGKGCCG
jgi:hypothetical protein